MKGLGQFQNRFPYIREEPPREFAKPYTPYTRHRPIIGQKGIVGMPTLRPDAFEAELQERLRDAVRATLAARQARRDQMADLKRRRAYGLRRRHATKLRRTGGEPS